MSFCSSTCSEPGQEEGIISWEPPGFQKLPRANMAESPLELASAHSCRPVAPLLTAASAPAPSPFCCSHTPSRVRRPHIASPPQAPHGSHLPLVLGSCWRLVCWLSDLVPLPHSKPGKVMSRKQVLMGWMNEWLTPGYSFLLLKGTARS